MTEPDLYQLFAFPTEKREQLGYMGYKCICLGISLDRSHVELSRDIPSVCI